MKKIIFFLFLIGTALASGYVGALIEGNVYDYYSNPISSAFVQVQYPSYCYLTNGGISNYTDTTGHYQIGFWLYCYTTDGTINVEVTAEKSGYVAQTQQTTLIINANPSVNQKNIDFNLIPDQPPKITITPTTQDTWTTSVDVTIQYTDEDLANTYYATTTSSSCDGVTWQPASNPQTITLSSDGEWYVCARATDNAGNQKTEIWGPYRIDTIAPTSISISSNTVYTSSSSTIVTYTAEDNHALDKIIFTVQPATGTGYTVTEQVGGDPTASGSRVLNLGVGMNTIYAVAYDVAGNSKHSNTISVCRDTASPTIYALSPSSNSIFGAGSITFSWGANDQGCAGIDHYELYVDNIRIYSGSSTSYTTSTSEFGAGSHTWYIKVYDRAGNVKTSTSQSFTIDLQAPSVSLIAPTCVNGNFVAQYTASDNVGLKNITLALNGWSNTIELSGTSASGSETVPISSQSSTDMFTLYAYVYDEAGNEGTDSLTINWDSAAPQLTSASPADGAIVNTNSVTFDWEVQDVGCAGFHSVKIYIDGNLAYTSNDASGSTTVTLSEGQHSWYLIYNDTLGNSNQSETRTFTVDLTPPTSSISPTSSDWVNTDISFTISCNDNVGCDKTYYTIVSATAACPTDASAYTEGASGTITQSGEWKVCFYSTDVAGNIENVQESGTFKVDKEAPTVGEAKANLYFDGSTYWAKIGDHVVAYASTADGYSGVEACYYKTPAAEIAATFNGTHCVYEYDVPSNSNGVTFWFKAVDNASNAAEGTSATLNVDNDAPSLDVNAPTDWVNSSWDVTVSCADTGSGCNTSTIKLYVSETQITSCPTDYSSYSYTSYTANHYVWVCAAGYDNVGNLGISQPAEIKVDLQAPTVEQTYTNISYVEGTTYYTQPNKVVRVFAAVSDNIGIDKCEFSDGSIATYNGTHCVYEFTPTSTQDVWFRVYDLAGNTADTPNATIVVDAQAPSVSVEYNPNATVGGTLYVPAGALITVEALDDNFLRLVVNSTTYTTNVVQFNAPSTSGSYTVTAEAYDKAGNSASSTSTYVVDADVPSLGLSYSLDFGTQEVVFHIYVEDNMATTISCDVNGTQVDIQNATTYDYRVAAQSGSTITIQVTCQDYVGNSVSDSIAAYADWNAPTVTLIAPANNSYGNKFVFNVSDEATSVTCDVNVGGVVRSYTVTTGTAFEVPASDFGLPDGTYEWNVTCNDSVNVGSSETRVVKLDTTGPSITIVAPSSVTVGESFTINASLSDPVGISSCEIRIDGTPISSSLVGNYCVATTSISSSGTHTIIVFANDTLGNENTASKSIDVIAVTGGGGGGAFGGAGTACTADGYECSADADCCSGLCLDGICAKASEIEFSIEVPAVIEMIDNETKSVEVVVKNLAPFPLKNVVVSTSLGKLDAYKLDFGAGEEKTLTLTLNLDVGEYDGIIRVLKYNKSFEEEFKVVVINSSLFALKMEAEKSCSAAEDYATKLNNTELLSKVAMANAELEVGNYSGAKAICEAVLTYKPPTTGGPGITGLFIAAGTAAGKVLVEYWWVAALAGGSLVAILVRARKRELPRGFVEYEQTF